MKLFTCTNCAEIIYFENTWCQNCGYSIGLIEENNQLFALSAKDNTFKKSSSDYQYCANHQFNICNWLVPANAGISYCKACELNRTIPDLQNQQYREQWAKIESAKHRLIYSLLRQQLPFMSKQKDAAKGLCFDFVADEKDKKVFTGHDNGLITINIAEADDIEREMAKRNMHEPYRTVLGHFRHEVGHYYWDMLIANSNNIETFRQLFGDDRRDYNEALQQHYNQGAAINWTENYISAYASSHPWEDWAETWAHYMHIMDTLETACSFGIQVRPGIAKTKTLNAQINNDPYTEKSFEKIIQEWLPVTFAMNSLNRSMGVADIYPFVITPVVKQKLEYVHNICYGLRKK